MLKFVSSPRYTGFSLVVGLGDPTITILSPSINVLSPCKDLHKNNRENNNLLLKVPPPPMSQPPCENSEYIHVCLKQKLEILEKKCLKQRLEILQKRVKSKE